MIYGYLQFHILTGRGIWITGLKEFEFLTIFLPNSKLMLNSSTHQARPNGIWGACQLIPRNHRSNNNFITPAYSLNNWNSLSNNPSNSNQKIFPKFVPRKGWLSNKFTNCWILAIKTRTHLNKSLKNLHHFSKLESFSSLKKRRNLI